MLPIKIISIICKPGRFGQWIAALTVSLCAMTGGMGFAWPSGALPKIRSGEAGFTLDLDQQSWIVSILFLGTILSPIPSAFMMERLGRRNTLCVGVWLYVLAFLIISCVGGFWPLCVARVLKGVWIGLIYTVVPVYIGETVEPRIRGTLGTFFGVFLYVGSLMISFIGSYLPYVMLSVIPAIFTFILGILLCLIPESPYYYLSKSDLPAARSSLAWLRGFCDETVLNSIDDSIKKQMQNNSSFADIVKKPSSRKAFIIVLLLGSLQRTSGLAILLNFTSVTMPNYFVTAEEFTIILNGVWIVSCIASSFIMDKFGRRTLMGFSCAGSSITMLGVATWFFLRDNVGVDVTQVMWVPFFLLIGHGVAYSFGIVSIPTMHPGEIFSPEIKSKASSLASIWIAVVSGFILNIYLPLETTFGIYSNFLICSVSSLIGVFTAAFIMIETNGRSLEEIQEELEGSKPKKIVDISTKF